MAPASAENNGAFCLEWMFPSHEELSFLQGRRKLWLYGMTKTIMTSTIKKQKYNISYAIDIF